MYVQYSCSVRSLSTTFFSQGHVADGDVPQGVRRRCLGLLVAALEAAQDDVLTSPSHHVTSRNTAVKQTTTARQGRNVSANHQAMRAGAVGLRSRGWNGRLARRQIDTERGEEQRQERKSENKKRAQGRKEKRLQWNDIRHPRYQTESGPDREKDALHTHETRGRLRSYTNAPLLSPARNKSKTILSLTSSNPRPTAD